MSIDLGDPARVVTDEEKDALGLLMRASGAGGWHIFLPLRKIDEEGRTVWGYGAVEEPDYSKEIMDYATSLPNFRQWSDAAKKRSGGRSLGNVREQHNPMLAAGKVIYFEADDKSKAIYFGVEVVDEGAWNKVRSGVLTGFSIGGRYGKRWPDKDNPGYTRYTAIPEELSLVDAPCVPSATFQMVKADGQPAEVFPLLKLDKVLPTSPESVERILEEDKPIESFQVNSTLLTLEDTESVPKGDALVDAGASKPVPIADIANSMPIAPNRTRKVRKMRTKPIVMRPTAKQIADYVVAAHKAARVVKADSADVDAALLDSAVEALKAGATMLRAELGKADVLSTVKAAEQMVAALKEQSERGEVDASLLESVATTLGTLAEMVANIEPIAEAAMGESAGAMGANVENVRQIVEETPSADEADLQKAAHPIKQGGPVSTQSPAMSLIQAFQPGAAVQKILPEFAEALSRGQLWKARKLTDYDQQFFDEAFAATMHATLDEMGFAWRNRSQIFSKAMGGVPDPETLAKSIAAGDMPGINLLPLVRIMLPVYSGMGSRIPISNPRTNSNQATWRSLIGFGSASEADTMAVAEGSIGTAMAENFLTYQTPYRDIASNSKVTLKATRASSGYDDPLQVATINALAFLIRVRERNLLYNNHAEIPAPTNVNATGGSSGGSLAASGSYGVKVTALVGRGRVAGDAGGTATKGETTATTVTNVNVPGAGAGTITVSWAAVRGAVAYNVYVSGSTGANFRYVATTGATRHVITAYPASGNDAPLTNTTASANGYEGLTAWAELNTIYGVATPGPKSFVDVGGAGLTAGDGGITQINQVLRELWTNWQISPTILVCSPKTKQAITSKLLSLANNSLYRIELQQERGRFVGGASVGAIINQFAGDGDQQPEILVQGNPYMYDGNILLLCESIPYPMSRVSQAFQAEQLLPFTYFPLAQVAIDFPFAITASEVLQCFHASAQAAIVGFDVSA